MAKQLVSKIDKILDEVGQEEFARNIEEIVDYEWELPHWTMDASRVHLPAFNRTEYQRLYKEDGPKQALQYWVSRLSQRRTQTGRLGDFFELTFGDRSGRCGVARTYTGLGGAPGLFWCSVYEADPEAIVPETVTEEILFPHALSSSRKVLYRAMYLKNYTQVLLAKCLGEATVLGDIERATATLEAGRRLYAGLEYERAFVAGLASFRDIMNSPEEVAKGPEELLRQRYLWSIAKPRIIAGIADRQSDFFATCSEAPDLDKERDRLITEYVRRTPAVGHWNKFSARRSVQSLSDRLLKEAGSAKFVGRKSPIFKGGRTREFDVVVVVHISGCPHAVETQAQGLAFGRRSAMFPGDPNPLLKLEDLGIALETGHAHCPHCMPLRWLQDQKDVVEKVGLRLAVLAERSERESSLKTGAVTTQAEMELASLLGVFWQADLSELRPEIGKLVQQDYHRDPQHFGILQQAMRALGTVATEADVPLLAEILHESPHWDLRLLAAGALGNVKHPTALTALREASEADPFYFVHHAAEAAESRASAD